MSRVGNAKSADYSGFIAPGRDICTDSDYKFVCLRHAISSRRLLFGRDAGLREMELVCVIQISPGDTHFKLAPNFPAGWKDGEQARQRQFSPRTVRRQKNNETKQC